MALPRLRSRSKQSLGKCRPVMKALKNAKSIYLNQNVSTGNHSEKYMERRQEENMLRREISPMIESLTAM